MCIQTCPAILLFFFEQNLTFVKKEIIRNDDNN